MYIGLFNEFLAFLANKHDYWDSLSLSLWIQNTWQGLRGMGRGSKGTWSGVHSSLGLDDTRPGKGAVGKE